MMLRPLMELSTSEKRECRLIMNSTLFSFDSTFCLDSTLRRNYVIVVTVEKLTRPASKGTITSKIKHATKLKTSPARLAGLVLSFIACFILLVNAP